MSSDDDSQDEPDLTAVAQGWLRLCGGGVAVVLLMVKAPKACSGMHWQDVRHHEIWKHNQNPPKAGAQVSENELNMGQLKFYDLKMLLLQHVPLIHPESQIWSWNGACPACFVIL